MYIKLLERIQAEMPELSYIDEDCGQLEVLNDGNEDYYPVTFPCVLVGNMEADWEDIGMGAQSGHVQLVVRLAIDNYHDTHIGSGTTDRIRERMAMANRLYCILQGYSLCSNMDGMVRTKSRNYTLPGGIKVYEYVFSFDYHDESALSHSLRRR